MFSSNNTKESLCLACCSSLPPSKLLDLFTTNCCKRPICSSCVNSNPRLARYDPCLACLAGVNLLASTSAGSGSARNPPWSPPIINLSGEVRDEDTFILGDDEEDDDDEVVNPKHRVVSNVIAQSNPTDDKVGSELAQADEPSPLKEVTLMPVKYYLNPSDTLHGLSLRFGVDIHEVCRLNKLPPSIIRNPNLLHTRAFLFLPPTPKTHASLTSTRSEDEVREADLVRERAVKRLQMLTKEVDPQIARTYVALADDDDEQQVRAYKVKEVSGSQRKPHTSTSVGVRLESLAIEKYLDDLEWETEEIKAGRLPRLSKFPFGDFARSRKEKNSCFESVG